MPTEGLIPSMYFVVPDSPDIYGGTKTTSGAVNRNTWSELAQFAEIHDVGCAELIAGENRHENRHVLDTLLLVSVL